MVIRVGSEFQSRAVTRPNPRGHRNLADLNYDIKCFYCKKSGHKISECHALKKKKKRNSVGFEKAKEDNSEKTKNQKLNLKEPSGELQATFKQNGQAQLQLNRLKQEVLEKERRYERELKSSKDERNKLLGEASKREDDLQFLSKQLREQLEHKDRILKEKSDIISSLEQQWEHAQEDSKGQIEQLNVEPKAQDLDEGKLKMDLESFSKLQILFIWLLMPVTVLVWYLHIWAQMVLHIWLWIIPLWRRHYPLSWQNSILRFIWILPLFLLRSTRIQVL